MWLDFYMIVTLVSGIVLTILGYLLCGIHIPQREDMRKLRTARAILAASYFILSIPAYVEFLTESSFETDQRIIAAFTIATAAYQSLLFTATLLTLINPVYITRRRVWLQIGIVTAVVAFFLYGMLIYNTLWIFFVALAAYLMQLTCYTIVFNRKYAESLRMLEEYYDEDQSIRLRWTKFSFYAALAVGIAAFVSVWLPPMAYNLFTFGYIAFYAWFANRFSNYAAKVNYYVPAVMKQPASATDAIVSGLSDSDIAAKKEHLRLSLECWVAELDFTRPEEGREQIARELGTTKDFLNWYFKTEIRQDFRSWRIGLRIGYARQLMAEEFGISMNDLAKKVGYVSKSNFYGHFKKLTGETPLEYRQRIMSER